MRNQILEPGKLLDENGTLIQAGYATSLVKQYLRKDIKANRMRVKEWDYYLINNQRFGIALTIADNSYMGLLGASFLDFSKASETTKNIMCFMPRGSVKLPQTSIRGDSSYEDKHVKIHFKNDGKVRKLFAEMKEFDGDDDFKAEIELAEYNHHDSMVIATPFTEKKTAFYYNQKIIGMKARGKVSYQGRLYAFNEGDSYGLLDWGRGVWTYNNTWYWGAAQGKVDGVPFGFNIGYGFGDTAAASENMLFYNGRAHKLDDVKFHIPKDMQGHDSYLESWTFSSSDGRFEMKFTPILDRASKTDAVVISSNQHQVFGRFTGKAVLDDGRTIEVKDFLGFAEKVKNKW